MLIDGSQLFNWRFNQEGPLTCSQQTAHCIAPECALDFVLVIVGKPPHIKQPIYGARALDFVFDLNSEDFDLAKFFGEKAPVSFVEWKRKCLCGDMDWYHNILFPRFLFESLLYMIIFLSVLEILDYLQYDVKIFWKYPKYSHKRNINRSKLASSTKLEPACSAF